MIIEFFTCELLRPRLNTAHVVVYLQKHLMWPVRLSVRTPGFQPGKRGSIPLRAATLFEIKQFSGVSANLLADLRLTLRTTGVAGGITYPLKSTVG